MSPEVCPCQKLLSRRPTGRNITVAAETPMKKVETVERERGTMKQVLDQLKNLEGGCLAQISQHEFATWMDGWMRTSVHGSDPSLKIIHWPLIPPRSHFYVQIKY